VVSSDKQLQRLGFYAGVSILSPRDLLAVLDQIKGDDQASS